jgi:preprotein translocase subunit SecE
MRQVIEFLKESRAELMKVSWPTRKQMINHTVVVIGVSLIAAVFFGTLDSTFGYLAQKFLFR